ncbi:MAG: 1-deoxy-D-xylulose-5-phosphate reductoisomerase, partial [Clostridiales bacterium]|nr:1-deoxy-D-xylulose-5-phosphate reductoisomerase [Candidatus Coliplasma equi]
MCENKISLIGSTGSIGTQTLDVARRLNLRVTALSANSSVRELETQCREFNPEYVCIGDEYYKELKTLLADTDIKIFSGDDGLLELIERDESKTLVNAVLGMKGLKPTLKAASLGKKIAFANKETLVAGGKLVLDAVKKGNSVLLPVASEHSAIFQCLNCGNKPKKLLLTGSGGPFLGKDKAFLETVTPEMAVKHPKWKMGKKISVDSATLMNKGLELI